MLLFGLAALAAIGGFAFYNRKPAGAPMANGQPPPGTVRVGQTPTLLSLQGGSGGMGTSAVIGTSSQIAQTGVGLAAGLGVINRAGDLAKAVPIVGAIVGIGLTIYGIISQHHKQALAAEGKALNDATPRAIQTLVLIVQATLAREITTASAAQDLVNQTIAAFYGEVRPIQRGTWKYLDTDFAANQTYENSWKAGAPGVQHTQDALKSNWPPDPCNGACVVGHYFVERGGKVAMAAVNNILAGLHGTAVFPTIPPYQTQQGFASVTISY